MRVMGHNALAIIVAAIAIYAVGFLIFGLLLSDAWVAATGYTKEQLESGMSKMPIGFVIPILLAIGLSLAVKWRNQPGWMGGVVTGALVALFLTFPQFLYGYVYSPAGGETLLAIDALHTFAGCIVGGAILGAWK
ncbi:MAG: DUF1761 domain-containing protein [Hyphomonadaceae bacterium]